ncbi:Na/Pi cotransporter family protein [Eubacterium pyruvativorans]|uniref:Na/Pi cotransporter family protein n=1 Tax=Eubacterium pyruvativorans TaxID=155865 RepID=UPI0023F16B06|nr:Na/Pi cotransporter family protein [Eubacterium pyruvativorans]MCI5747476.1 Na/Pi cotransporter family protein [Eubacterium pyruvativorans]MDD7684596.1 Na/Pi cotransporter family protein [Eubacterium pyruvativorans]MDY4049170.1 Na/Pi cotransporter family protein [Eubacterium pyruvativorans]
MDIFSFFTLFGGLAFFLYGMTIMSSSLEKVAGGKMEVILNKMTSNKYMGLLLGAVITIAIQSSSAVTVMLVGLVNSGIMDISNTIGVIMGSNIGTTVTAWIMSMIGISSSNVFVRMLKPESFSPIMALVGIIMVMTGKTNKKRDIGTILIGFAILMYGMKFMSDSVSPLADDPRFETMMAHFTNPLLGILVGLGVTAVIQSSAASVGMLQALAMTGQITWGMAIPIIMGQNIGTCATALISSIGVNRNAKRVTVLHILFNVIGTVLFMAAYFIGYGFLNRVLLDKTINPVEIALFHSIFNITTTVILLPFTGKLVAISKRVIKTEDRSVAFLDERLLNTPTVAVAECNRQTDEMGRMALRSLHMALELLSAWDEQKAQIVRDLEREVDEYEDHIGTFLVKVSALDLTEADSAEVSKMLHSITEFERISDHALNIVETAVEIHEKDVRFSEEGDTEVRVLVRALMEISSIAFQAYFDSDVEGAKAVEPLEEVIDKLTEKIKVHHVDRLQKGVCTIANGFVLTDLMNDVERVSDHCSNLALGVIELADDAFDVHEYQEENLNMSNPEFRAKYQEYKEKYELPHRNRKQHSGRSAEEKAK